ncbi:MAG: hypothetical protein H6742_14235 [Alphaproteobacteria bacterium]|nr:hypothetical protein [Alphaproteobacteria bacterium]
MRIPEDVRSGLRTRLWALADDLDWSSLSWAEKSTHYEAWTKDPSVGGQLAHYMDQRQIRVYVKDTIMKGYGRSRLANPERVMRVLGLNGGSGGPLFGVAQEYQRPHGRRLADGRVIAWGKAKDWKGILMTLHERAFESKGTPHAAVLMSAVGRFQEDDVRALVQDAATKLGVVRLVWLT